MNAFRYIDGALVPCPDFGPRMMLAGKMPERVPQRLTPRERRHRARRHRGIRGRRGAIAVPRVVDVPTWLARDPLPYAAMPAPVRLDGHRFANGKRSVLLYLPEGERPTERHASDLDRALGR